MQVERAVGAWRGSANLPRLFDNPTKDALPDVAMGSEALGGDVANSFPVKEFPGAWRDVGDACEAVEVSPLGKAACGTAKRIEVSSN